MSQLSKIKEIVGLMINFFAGFYLMYLGYEIKTQDGNDLYIAIIMLGILCFGFFWTELRKYIKKRLLG